MELEAGFNFIGCKSVIGSAKESDCLQLILSFASMFACRKMH